MSPNPDALFGQMNHRSERLKRAAHAWPGVRHHLQVRPVNPNPSEPITLTVRTAGSLPFYKVRCWYTTDGSSPTEHSDSLDFTRSAVEWSLIEWDYAAQWQAELAGFPAGTYLRYIIGAQPFGSRRWHFADNQSQRFAKATPFALLIGHNERPDWAQSAVIYQVFLDRFYPGDGQRWQNPGSLSGIYGGTLRGVIQKLDYIQGLGCNAIWLSPIFASDSHHRYDAYDYYQIEPRIGTNEEFEAFIAEAHARDIRVIMDFVANHWSNNHFTMRAAQQDRHSPYYDWYDWIEWPHNYHTFFGVMTMPRLQLQQPAARQYIYECAQYWLRQGVDGFRLDHAHGPSIDFWAGFRLACRAVKPDCWLFGEVTEGAGRQLGYANAMDGLCDFLLSNALRQTFALENWSLGQFEVFLTRNDGYLREKMMLPAFLDNHDMNRFLFVAGEDKQKLRLAALVLLTLPGPPIIYNGTESGESQERSIHQNSFGVYEEARLPMRWDECFDSELMAHFQTLIELRRRHPIIWEGKRRPVYLDEAAGCWGYCWGRPAGPPQLLILINRSTQSQTVTLEDPGFTEPIRDLLGDQPTQLNGQTITVMLAPQSGVFLAPGRDRF